MNTEKTNTPSEPQTLQPNLERPSPPGKKQLIADIADAKEENDDL